MTAPILLAAIFSYAAFLISACAADPETPQTSATPAPSPTEAEISDTAARLELAKVLTYDKRYKEAIDTDREVLTADPENLEAKVGLSEVLYWLGNPEAAAATLKGVS